ncbi:LysR family transcriptional regulator [Bradyrhizobium quebecense]|uniref:LysR family transcriptional regulator n=1 Tax=Bradyrhizobium quebecense TaxID=2748629 RepID=A0A973WYB3_9BRAD|nr:LysR family transcriptional regulator [Bradyrhizobium quebecense]UGA43202.1 LysR family transcriptional regulator [Bradyrhizobium quebecense]
MDRLEEFRLFLAIVDSGKFASAGRKFARSPSSTTRIVAELERRLGTRLLQRTTRKLSLTDSGARLAAQARRLLADYDEAIDGAIGEAASLRGNIKLSAPTLFGSRHIAPLVRTFLERHPDITLQLALEDRLVDLIDERIDIALRIGHLTDSSLRARRIGEVRRIVVASPDYLKRHGRPRRPDDLAQHHAVTFVNQASPAIWSFQHKQAGPQKVKVSSRMEVNRAETAIGLTRDGMGLTRVLSYQVAGELAAGSLVRVLRDYEVAPIPVQLVYPSARLMAPRIRSFLDFAAGEIPLIGFNHL